MVWPKSTVTSASNPGAIWRNFENRFVATVPGALPTSTVPLTCWVSGKFETVTFWFDGRLATLTEPATGMGLADGLTTMTFWNGVFAAAPTAVPTPAPTRPRARPMRIPARIPRGGRGWAIG